MASKNIQLSTRITEEDAAFLARLQVEDAHTPSDKVRALIAEARRRHEARRDYRSALERAHELLGSVLADLRTAEHAAGLHSELVRAVADWLPDTIAFLLSETAPAGGGRGKDPGEALRATERGLADRTFRLVEAVLRLGVTEAAPCYDPAAISARVDPVLALLDVLRTARNARRPATAGRPTTGGGTT
ncbi:MAG TPA: hypothetical protein VEB43_13840 [Anaeromyxobacter sp.]|nr:hypothetical protein [Anaeromyxobacter sp.]